MLNAKFFKGPLNNFDRVKGVQGRLFACDVRSFCRRNSTLKGPQAQAVELLPCQACMISDVLGSYLGTCMLINDGEGEVDQLRMTATPRTTACTVYFWLKMAACSLQITIAPSYVRYQPQETPLRLLIG